MIKTYHEAKTYLEQFIPTPQTAHGTMQLDRIGYVCKLLGNPQTDYPIIHVGGTSGKGSTATFASYILKEAGLTVGLHVSPHLELITERLQINNQPIPVARFIALLNEIIPYFDESDKTSGLGILSYFERLGALAFYAFTKASVDAAVIEVGLGGKLDATNIILPSAAILTNISLDHTNILGKTVYSILKDKMGIIKTGTPGVVSGIAQPKLRQILINHCQKLGVPLYLLNRDFSLNYRQLGLPGEFQHENFTLAAQASRLFLKAYFPSKTYALPQALKQAAKSAFIPGRLEIISKHPLIILDGAHNKAKMTALTSPLKNLYPHQKFVTVVAVKQGKPARTLIRLLEPMSAYFICTSFVQTTDTGLHASNRANYLASLTRKPAQIINKSKEALRQAQINSVKQNLPILVTGSLYLVGEIRSYLKLELNDPGSANQNLLVK